MQTIIRNLNNQAISLDKQLDCGETFRWFKVRDNWFGVVGENLIELNAKTTGRGLAVEIETNLENPEDINRLKRYLDLYTDYNEIFNLEVLRYDKFASKSVEAGWGIRILQQDLWETLVSFIISQRNNIPKIKQTIKKLCDIAGHEVTIQGQLWGITDQEIEQLKNLKTFPTPREILDNLDRIESECGLGYRYDYIVGVAKRFERADMVQMDDSFRKTQIVIQNEKKATGKIVNDKVYDILLSFYGVGPKVANCVLLFGTHDISRFPIDVWMQRIIDRVYGGSLNPDVFGEYAGIIQQYMFYYVKSQNIL